MNDECTFQLCVFVDWIWKFYVVSQPMQPAERSVFKYSAIINQQHKGCGRSKGLPEFYPTLSYLSRSPLEQFFWTRIWPEKFRHCWKIPTVGIGKRPEKIPFWWEISFGGRQNIFRCMETLVLRHPSCRPEFTSLCISAVGKVQSPIHRTLGRNWEKVRVQIS